MSQNSNVSVANGGFLAQKDAQNYVKSAFVLKFLAFASRMEHKNANEFEPSYVDYVEFDTDLRKVALHCRSIFFRGWIQNGHSRPYTTRGICCNGFWN